MISANQVKELREKTGAGMMDCKKALAESGGDFEKALDFLKRQGILKAAKKSGRQTNEGLIMEAVDKDGRAGALIEVSCETDFVARTDDFQDLLKKLALHVLKTNPTNVESLLESPLEGKSVADWVKETVARLGENMTIRRFKTARAENDKSRIGIYIHPGNKVGTLVHVKGAQPVSAELTRDLAMHVTAMHPLYVSSDRVPADIADREKANLLASPDLVGKPPEIAAKIVEGKFRKYLQEICLLDQVFFREMTGKGSVRDHLKKMDPSTQVLDFYRYQVGEEA